MKNKTLSLICISLIFAILCGCSDNKANTTASTYSEPINANLTEIDIPFALVTKEETGKNPNMYTTCYSDENVLIIANVYDDIYTAESIIPPDIRTKGVYLINYNEKGKYTLFDIESDGVIYSAVPYKDGIIYAEYKTSEDEFISDNTICQWKIAYFDENKHIDIDSGYCKNKLSAEIVLIDEIPIYICENNSKNFTQVSVNKIVDFKIKQIKKFENCETLNLFETNGKYYFTDVHDSSQQKSFFIAGDSEKIYIEQDKPEPCSSFSITENYIVCAVGGEMGNTQIIGIPLNNSEEKKLPQTKQWWRITGSSGKYCTVVDDGFNLYYINIEECKAGQIILPEKIQSVFTTKMFFPAGKDRYIIELESEEIGDKFYVMEFS